MFRAGQYPILCTLVSAALLVSTAIRPAVAAEDRLFDDRKTQAVLDEIFNQAGHPTKVLSVEIEPDKLSLEVQDPKDAKHIDAWTYRSSQGLSRFFSKGSISGPRPVEPSLPNPDLDANLFELKSANLAEVSKMVAAAISHTALGDPGMVTRMTLKRRLFLIPVPRSGDPEWEIEVDSGRERATIYANVAGKITRADVSGTRRAQNVNYLAGGGELDTLIARIADAIGDKPVIQKAIVYNRSMTIEAATPGHPDQISLYNADINTVSRQTDLPPAAARHGSARRFAVTEIEWRLLPRLQQLARERLDLQNGRISRVEVSKSARAVGEPTVEWEINVNSAADEVIEGYVVFDAQGNVLRTKFPPGRAPKLDLLEAASLATILSQFGSTLGDHAATVELDFQPDRVAATIKDPDKSDEIANFDFRGESVERSIITPHRWVTFGPTWFFDLSTVAILANRWTDLQKETVSRLGLINGEVKQITISKQKLAFPHNDRVLVEIRAEQQGRKGRVLYDLNGKVVQMFKP